MFYFSRTNLSFSSTFPGKITIFKAKWTTKHFLTHWGRGTHICISKLTIIGTDNGLSPGRHQAIIWTNAGILSIQTLWTNFSEILSKIHTFSPKKMHLKMSSAKWQPFCLGLNVLSTPLKFKHFSRSVHTLKLRLLISQQAKFSIWQKYLLDYLNHVYIWQVPPQLSCGDTCQIWTWYSTNVCLTMLKISENNGTEEIGLVAY